LPAPASSIQIDACSTSITLPIVRTVSSPTASTDRASERASENSSQAVAFSASRRADSYSLAFSSATDACPETASSRRRSSSSSWPTPSFDIVIVPITR